MRSHIHDVVTCGGGIGEETKGQQEGACMNAEESGERMNGLRWARWIGSVYVERTVRVHGSGLSFGSIHAGRCKQQRARETQVVVDTGVSEWRVCDASSERDAMYATPQLSAAVKVHERPKLDRQSRNADIDRIV